MALPFILDTDIGSDVDDALALAFALRHPDFDLRAVTTVSGDTHRRALIAKKLLRLAGRDDIEVAAGVGGAAADPHNRAEGGHEDEMLGVHPADLEISQRDAPALLLDECAEHHYEVATVGMQSNIAAALERDGSFAGDVPRLTVMGGIFAPCDFLGTTLPPSIDHNLNVDQPASLRSLNAGMPMLFVPCNVTFSIWFTAPQLERLRKGDGLCRELARQIDIFALDMHAHGGGIIPDDYVCLLHDPLAVACMTDAGRRFVRTQQMRVTTAMHEGSVRTFIDPAAGQPSDVVTGVDAPAFAEFWLTTVLG